MWTQPHATICGWPEDSFLLELYRRAFTLSQMHLVPDTPSAVKKQLHKRAKQTARRPGDPLTSKPRRSFSFQKQKCVTFLSQNSSGFTTHTSDTSAGITFWETAATRRQNTGRGDNTQAHKLGGGSTVRRWYLQHEHHGLHGVPLGLPSVHDDGEAASLALLTAWGEWGKEDGGRGGVIQIWRG